MGFVKVFGITEGAWLCVSCQTQSEIPLLQPSAHRSSLFFPFCGLLQAQPLLTVLAEFPCFELWLGVLAFVAVVVIFYATFLCV